MFEMLIKKIEKSTYFGKNRQTVLLSYPNSKDEFLFIVNQKIDLSPFKKGDKVLVTFEISRKGSLKSPYFYIKEIEKNVILIKGREAYA